DRGRAHQSHQPGRLHRHRAGRADHHGRRSRRPAAGLGTDTRRYSPVTMKVETAPAVPTERLLYEVKKVIVGQDHLLERLAVALLARGHLLVEGVPGLAKTMAIKTLASSIGGEFKRIQF